MKANDFRRLALLLEGAEEGSHMGSADFRVGGRMGANRSPRRHGADRGEARVNAGL